MKKSSIKYIVASVILIIASFSFVRTTFQIMKSSSRLEALQDEVYQLEVEKANLNREVAFMRTDDYIEQEARNKLSMVRSNELVYVVDPELREMLEKDNVLSKQDSSIKEEAQTSQSNLHAWFKLLF